MSLAPQQAPSSSPDAPAPQQAGVPADKPFNPDETMHFQSRMPKAPEWFCSFLASNKRETRRFRDELAHIKGAWPLLMKERQGGKWTEEDKVRLQGMLRSASAVSPYLAIWALPGSMALVPFLAWYLDRRRRQRGEAPGIGPG
ncbi:MAG TPA: hypothetical protein PK347_15370 [Burkholderiaceae bacterium]|nr:hypothetical protein [Burkholderiaceae bacterium]